MQSENTSGSWSLNSPKNLAKHLNTSFGPRLMEKGDLGILLSETLRSSWAKATCTAHNLQQYIQLLKYVVIHWPTKLKKLALTRISVKRYGVWKIWNSVLWKIIILFSHSYYLLLTNNWYYALNWLFVPLLALLKVALF